MSGLNTGGVSSLRTRNQHAWSPTGRGSSPRNIARGSGANHGQGAYCYWIPKLKQLVKKVCQSCHGCKRFQESAYAAPPPRNLPTTRTQGTKPYQVIGVDYAGPIRYRVSKQREGASRAPGGEGS